MSLQTDVEAEVRRIFMCQWTTPKAMLVPQASSIALERNDARQIDDATVLYADLSGSTNMVQTKSATFAAEVYRAFLYSAAQLIRSEGGEVTAYDGDRVMAVFMAANPNTSAVRCALKIHYAVKQIINSAIAIQYGVGHYTLKHVVGIDRSPLLVARTGVRGDNDLVWVGRAANYAAKLTEIPNDDATFITPEVFERLHVSVKNAANGTGELMWRDRKWTQMGDMPIYSSNYWWSAL